MNEQEIKKIVCAVVDYGWPWQYDDWQSPFVTAEDQSIGHLFHCFYLQECKPGYDDLHVRLDPNHPHDWPIETRARMVVWYRVRYWTDQHGSRWSDWDISIIDIVKKRSWPYIKDESNDFQFVAPHPLHPDQPPPDDWTPESKRTLK
jgi:hypothetical protein